MTKYPPTPRTDAFVADYVIANYKMGSDEATDVIIGELSQMEQEIAALSEIIESMKENNHN